MRMTIKSAWTLVTLATVWLVAIPAAAQSTTYLLSSGPFDEPGQFVEPCAVAACRTLTTAAASGAITLSAPLPPDALIDATSLVTAYSVTAAGLTIDSTDPLARMPMLSVLTDASGAIEGFYLDLQRLASSTYETGDASPDARLDTVVVTSSNSLVWANFYCSSGRLPDGTCYNRLADDSSSTAFGGPGALTAPGGVPTLSEWALLLLGLMLAGGVAIHLARRDGNPARRAV